MVCLTVTPAFLWFSDKEEVLKNVRRLPEINKLVLTYLIRFLQVGLKKIIVVVCVCMAASLSRAQDFHPSALITGRHAQDVVRWA
jgi:hypothetical protein